MSNFGETRAMTSEVLIRAYIEVGARYSGVDDEEKKKVLEIFKGSFETYERYYTKVWNLN